MKLLVTGANGFIGSNLSLELEKQGHEVIALDKAPRSDTLSGFKGSYVQEDITEVDWDDFKDVSAMFHQAAITDTTVYDEKLMMSVNYAAFENILKFATNNKIPLIYASSAAVYGAAQSPQKESDAGKPLNIYGISKFKSDILAKEYMAKISSPIIGLRYFNVFGPREHRKGKMASMIWQLYLQMKDGNRPRDFKYGEQSRDQVYVKDIVNANLLAWKSKKSGITNVGSGSPVSFNTIINELNAALGANLQPEYIDNPYSKYYQASTQADISHAKILLDYEPRWKFPSAVKDYVSEIRKV